MLACSRCLVAARVTAAAAAASPARAAAAAAPAARRSASIASACRSYSTNKDDADPNTAAAADRQARVDRLLSKARALKIQHLQSQGAGSSSSSSPATRPIPTSSGGSKHAQYAQALKRKAEQAGFESVEALRQSLRAQSLHAGSAGTTVKTDAAAAAAPEETEALRERLRARAAEKDAERQRAGAADATQPAASSSPVKPLSAIMDLNKLLAPGPDGTIPTADAAQVAELWTTYHTLKNKLSAVIPLATYSRMLEVGSRYPRFVVPLPRGPAPAAAEDAAAAPAPTESGGHEMYYLEWGVLPLPTPHLSLASTSPSSTNPLPKPSTVLFTSLAEYKLRQEFAQPSLVLTHYTDLAHSHGVVLMRGEVTADNADLGDAEAQRLCILLQRFYLPGAAEPSSNEHADLVRIFHEKPDAFDVSRLINASNL
ncbi:hypothetical protein OC844_001886 [Tilletia horrida]|nr:hypothetical protein OC844_001886 [Tilletia horrida]